MCKLKQPWRHAASVIVAASRKLKRPHYVHPNDPIPEIMEQVLGERSVGHKATTDLSILMAKRRSDSRVMPGVYTFPGGALHPSDFDIQWAESYLQNVVHINQYNPSIGFFQPYKFLENVEAKPCRPPAMVEFHEFRRNLPDPRSQGVWMPAEWAFKLCALRELFEETGILICHDLKSGQVIVKSTATQRSDDPNVRNLFFKPLEQHRQSVHKDASSFGNVCRQLEVIPAFWTLREWSNWLSPSTYANRRRFDTIFYVVCLDDQVEATVEETELEKAEWIDPRLMLRSGSKGDLQLAPPQIYELARLAKFESSAELNVFAHEREIHGLIQFFPLLGKCTDEVRVAIMPGDDLYPKKPDFFACDQPLVEFDSTSRVLREKSKNLHRAEFLPSSKTIWSSAKLYMNIKPACEHVVPLQSFDD